MTSLISRIGQVENYIFLRRYPCDEQISNFNFFGNEFHGGREMKLKVNFVNNSF